MACHACSRRTLSPFIRSFTSTANVFSSHVTTTSAVPSSRSFTSAPRPKRIATDDLREERRPWKANNGLGDTRRQRWENSEGPSRISRRSENPTNSYQRRGRTEPPKPFATNKPLDEEVGEEKEKPHWLIHKEAMKEKLAGEAWNPRKKLSPDTMEGIRHLSQTQPERFTIPVLAEHFKVSPEAIRRILKSKWRPTDEEQEERMRRWDKRGEKIWSNLVELGIKPPKKWREMGVGRAEQGQRPKWKTGARNSVPVNDSFELPPQDNIEDLIPIVDGTSWRNPKRQERPLSERLGI